MNILHFKKTSFLLAIVFLFGIQSDLYAQIWELANKTHRSTSIIPGSGKVIFSISNHLFFSSDLGKSFTVDDGSESNNINGFAIGSIGKFYFSTPMALFSSPAYNDMNNEDWKRIDTGIPSITSLFVRAGNGIVASDEIYVGTAAGLWRSESTGGLWLKIHDALDGLPIQQIAAFNNSIYYRTLTTLWASHDRGSNWKAINTHVTNGNNTAILATNDTDLYIAISGFPGSHILHSNDGGDSFFGFRGIDFGNRTIETLVASSTGDLYLAGGVRDDVKNDSITQGYAFRFLHDGFAWEDYSGGLPSGKPSPEVIGMGFGPNGNVFACTDSAGIWRSLLPSAVHQTAILSGITLSQNFPNPANLYTEFSLFTDHSMKASLGVFDALGRNVQEITDGQITPGTYFYRIETRSLPNGTYFYKLQTPQGIESRSFIISK